MHRKSARLDINKWPVGGARLEPIANIVYGMPTLTYIHTYQSQLIFLYRFIVSILNYPSKV